MAAFEYRQALEIRDVFGRYGVRYLFIGKSGAILLGFPDTTQDADLFIERSPDKSRSESRERSRIPAAFAILPRLLDQKISSLIDRRQTRVGENRPGISKIYEQTDLSLTPT